MDLHGDSTNKVEAHDGATHDFAHAIASATEGLWEWELATGRVSYSTPWYALLGLTPDRRGWTIHTWFGRVHPDDLAALERAVERHLTGATGRLEHEFRMLHADGEYRWVIASGVAARDGVRPLRIAGSLRDVTARRLFDPLTGLPNHAALLDRVAGARARATRDPRYRFALLVADVDRFKRLRLTHGQTRIDAMLLEVAARLTRAVETRGAGARLGDVVARLGNDEFGILLNDVDGAHDALNAAETIARALRAPIEIDGEAIFTTASIGVAMSADRHREPEELVQEAIAAAQRAKRGGAGRSAVYDMSMHTQAVARHRLEGDLRSAIEHDTIDVHYQPIVDLAGGTVVGFEALARWTRPGHGHVAPSDFVAVAEEADLIDGLGELVLARACRAARRWLDALDRGADRARPTLSVNISARQLMDDRLVTQLARGLAASGLPRGHLKLELTESLIMATDRSAQRRLHKLKDLGAAIVIDDFGTGYSSLAYLHRLPIDELKIDRSFVSNLCDNHESHAIVDTILTLAHKLDVGVVAEGVETAEQRACLLHLGCSRGQGFLWGRATPEDAIPSVIGATLGPAPSV